MVDPNLFRTGGGGGSTVHEPGTGVTDGDGQGGTLGEDKINSGGDTRDGDGSIFWDDDDTENPFLTSDDADLDGDPGQGGTRSTTTVLPQTPPNPDKLGRTQGRTTHTRARVACTYTPKSGHTLNDLAPPYGTGTRPVTIPDRVHHHLHTTTGPATIADIVDALTWPADAYTNRNDRRRVVRRALRGPLAGHVHQDDEDRWSVAD